MSASFLDGAEGDPVRRTVAPLRLASWLGLAAAPTFAAMAFVTGVLGGGPMEMLCSVAPGIPVNGMVLMYALMSAFHLGPWLRLASR